MGTTIATKMGTGDRTSVSIGQTIAAALLGLRQVVTAIKHRRQLADLVDAEDHRLSDMGITRDDLEAALSEPLWRDPTTALAHRAGRSSKTPMLPGTVKTTRPRR